MTLTMIQLEALSHLRNTSMGLSDSEEAVIEACIQLGSTSETSTSRNGFVEAMKAVWPSETSSTNSKRTLRARARMICLLNDVVRPDKRVQVRITPKGRLELRYLVIRDD